MSNFFPIVIAGSREFIDYATLEKRTQEFIAHLALHHVGKQIMIVSGAARGADTLGERFALNNNCRITKMPADWNKYGRGAGYRRNEEMVAIAHAAIYFWDGESHGTKHCMDQADKKGIPYAVVIGQSMQLHNMAKRFVQPALDLEL